MATQTRARTRARRFSAGRVAALRAPLPASTELLTRLFFAALVGATALVEVVDMLYDGVPPGGNVLLGVAGLAGLALWTAWQHRPSGRTPLGDVVGLVALLAAAAGSRDVEVAFALQWLTLFVRVSVLPRRRAFLSALGWWAAAAVSDGVAGDGGGFGDVSHWVLFLPFALLMTDLMTRLVGALARNDRSRCYQEILAAASPALVAADDEIAAGAAIVEALAALAGDVRDGVVSAWRLVGDDLVLVGAVPPDHVLPRVPLASVPAHMRPCPADGLLRRFDGDEVTGSREAFRSQGRQGHVVVRLLVGRDPSRATGSLVISSREPLDGERVEALDRLGVEAGLAFERVALTSDLARSEALFRGVVQSSSDVIALLDADAVVSYVSPALERVAGIDPDLLLGRAYTDFLHPDDAETILRHCSDLEVEGEPATGVQVRMPDGQDGWRHVEVTVDAQGEDGKLTGFVVVMRDVSARRALEEELARQAFHDALTGLANRTLFAERVEHAILRAARSGGLVGLALFDLDDFKAVNDALGHAAGDALLVEVASRLRAFVRATDTPARLGGDEFAVLLDDLADAEEGEVVARRVLEAFSRPFRIADRDVIVRTSVGLATGDGDASLEALLRNADVAMYAAKDAGKGRFQVFETAMHDAALARLELRVDLEGALDRREMEVVYQPIVDIASGAVSGMEALLRWHHPGRGLLGPDVFIPIAEETGLIVPLGRWVLAQACREVRGWRASSPALADVSVNVNLSARQFRDPGLVECVVATLAAEALPPGALRLEVTETALIDDVTTASAVLAALHEHGVRVAIDDFGTGYSTFSYLRRFLVDEIKIDREFVRLAAAGPEDAALLRAILKVGHTLDLRTVAEGVEDAADLAALRAWGCDQAQGYLLARPMGAGAARTWLADRGAEEPARPRAIGA